MRISDWSSDVCSSDLGTAFVGGSALWAVRGHSAGQDKATASFLGWLAQPENAAKWYQSTGYLPLTTQAFAATDASYYKNLGGWRDIVASYASNPDATARGFWINNYPKVRAMLRQTLDRKIGRAHVWTPVTNAHL